MTKMYTIIIKTNTFSKTSRLLKKDTLGPDGIVPVSVREALRRLITDANYSKAKERVST